MTDTANKFKNGDIMVMDGHYPVLYLMGDCYYVAEGNWTLTKDVFTANKHEELGFKVVGNILSSSNTIIKWDKEWNRGGNV